MPKTFFSFRFGDYWLVGLRQTVVTIKGRVTNLEDENLAEISVSLMGQALPRTQMPAIDLFNLVYGLTSQRNYNNASFATDTADTERAGFYAQIKLSSIVIFRWWPAVGLTVTTKKVFPACH